MKIQPVKIQMKKELNLILNKENKYLEANHA